MNRARGIGLIVLLAAIVILFGLLTGSEGGAYRIADAGPQGYAGLAAVLERLGTDVSEVDLGDVDLDDVDPGAPGSADTLFVPKAALLSDAEVSRLRRYASIGHRVVFGAPPGGVTFGLSETRPVIIYRDPGACTQEDLAAVADLGRIDTADLEGIEPVEGESICFGDRSTDVLVTDERIGDGRLITLAGPELFVNDVMRELDQPADEVKGPMADNVVVAARLLAPAGGGSVRLVVSGFGGTPAADDERGLFDVMPLGARLALAQGVAALAFLAIARSRRWGRVIDEPLIVDIAGSELIEARAGLMGRRKDPQHAADSLRADIARRIAADLGMPRWSSIAVLVPTIAARTGREPAAIGALLGGTPIDSDAALVRLADALDQLRKDLRRDRHPTDA